MRRVGFRIGVCLVSIFTVLGGALAKAPGSSEGVVAGRVVTAGQPVAGANVAVIGGPAGQTRRLTCDADGHFHVELPAGSYRVAVTADGYANAGLDRVDVAEGQTVEVVVPLQPLSVSEAITVTGKAQMGEAILQAIEAQQALTPGALRVVDGAEFYSRSTTNLADMLRYVPGVWSESASGSDEVFFSSRGSNLDATDYDNNGIKMLQDGLPVTTADGNNHNRIIDPLSARFATVAPGANALAYGASTLGGAIDFTSPTARTSAPLSLYLNGGSNGLVNGQVSAGVVSGALDGLATLEDKSYDGYRDHTSQERAGAYLNGGWSSSDSSLTRVWATFVENKQQLAGALSRQQMAEDPDQANAAALTGDFKKNVRTARIAGKSTWQLNENSSFAVGLSAETQSLYHPIVDVRVDFDGPGPMTPVQVFSLLVDTDHRDLGSTLRYDLHAGKHELQLGANYGDGSVNGGNYRNEGGERNGLMQHVHNASSSLETFAVDHWRLAPQWTLVYGTQYVDSRREARTTDAATGAVVDPRGSYSSFNPRLGVIYALSGQGELFASVSRTYEPPTTFELADDVRGNDEALAAMHGTVYEIGARSSRGAGRGTSWHWNVSAYYAQIRDEILSVDDPSAPGTALTTNIDKTIHAGLEGLIGASVALDGQGRRRLDPLLTLTWNDFKFAADPHYGDNRLPAAPTYAVRAELLYRDSSGIYAGPTADLIGSRFADFSNTYRVQAYELLGLRTGFQGKRWEVYLEVRNLLDRDYVSTLTVLDTAAPNSQVLNPGAPRSAYLGLRLQL